MRLQDLTGKTFGRWTVIGRDTAKSGPKVHWLCRCACGKTSSVQGTDLKAGTSKSCGCLRVETNRATWTTHGATDTPEYVIWCAMFARCTNPNHPSYPNYGARGIRVSPQWYDFARFLADVGPRPGPDYSIERIDNNGDYGPGNCRWATRAEQNNNRRDNRLVTFGGRTMSVSAWAREVGLERKSLTYRLDHGWSAEAALTTPAVPGRNQYSPRRH